MGIKKELNNNTKTVINLVSSIATLVLSTLISFFLSPFIVEHLGEEANGFTQLANNFITYASLLSLALNSMAARFITVSYHQGDKKTCEKYYSSVIVGNMTIISVLILPAVFCIWKLENIINISGAEINHVKILFLFVFANFFVSQITGIFNIATYVKNSIYLQNLINVITSFLKAMLLLLVFSLLPIRMYYVSIVGFSLSILGLMFAIVVKKRLLNDIIFNYKSFDIGTIGKLVSSGIWNAVNQCGHILMTGLDLLLANLFIGAGPMGILSVAKTVPTMVTQLGNSINTSFSPKQTITYSKDSQDKLLESLSNASKTSCAILPVPIMVFCVFSVDFYSLWQPTLNAKMLAILSILTLSVYIPFCGTQTLYNVFTAMNKLKVNSISFIITGIISAISTIILVNVTDWGVYAVAGISSAFSILRNMIITLPYTARLLKKKWYYFYKDVLLSLLSCSLVGIISFIFKTIASLDNWIVLILSCAATAIISCVVNAFIILNKKQRSAIMKKIKQKFSREKKSVR